MLKNKFHFSRTGTLNKRNIKFDTSNFNESYTALSTADIFTQVLMIILDFISAFQKKTEH